MLLVTSKKDELFVAGKMRSHLTYPGNCTCGRKELTLLHFESYHHELNDIFHSLIAIAALPCWKLSTLGHMNVSYMHIYIFISISIYLLINFSICEANPKRFQNSRSDKVTAQHLLSCFVVGEIKLP